MKTSVVGFPRVGSLRELKFATEKYFRGEMDGNALEETARRIRIDQWKLQLNENVSYLPSNDFSYYDGMLDTTVLLNLIPEKYKVLGLSARDTYFAMARGYQGEKGDVTALPMKKWFNTNYHYMVPELEDTMDLCLANDKPFLEYEEALKNGIKTKPVLIGPFTYLKLARYGGKKQAEDYRDKMIAAYQQIIGKLGELGAEWIQLDEPYLVEDLTEEECAFFEALYEPVLAQKGDVKILLQTYFGDIRDCYQQVIKMKFDGIGLDFMEGKQTTELIREFDFPKDKILFAGLVNGKNIWRNHYEKTLLILDELQERDIQVVLSTSCSLLHVPYSLEHETKLSQEVKRHFAFTKEKLVELQELSILGPMKSQERIVQEKYEKNQSLFLNLENRGDDQVKRRVEQIREQDFVRKPEFEEREKIQKREFALPLFPTTTIGSFPQTAEVKARRKAFRRGDSSKEEYEKFVRESIAKCVRFQEEIGLDVLVHGEYERNDMVEYFGEQLNGFLFTEKGWVQSYGTRCVKPPIIYGDVSRRAPMTVEWVTYAQSLTKRPMKGMLTGPVTILNWSFPREDITRRECAYQIALAIRDEVLDLEKNGIRIIQVDEAALREKLPLRKSDWNREYLDWAIPAFRLVHSGVKPKTQIHTHMCYSEFTDIISAIDDMDADVITFEASRSDLQILDALMEQQFKTQVGPGVYDIHSPRIPSVEELCQVVAQMTAKVKKEKLWMNPDCGLKTRGTKEVEQSLKNMIVAAERCRNRMEQND